MAVLRALSWLCHDGRGRGLRPQRTNGVALVGDRAHVDVADYIRINDADAEDGAPKEDDDDQDIDDEDGDEEDGKPHKRLCVPHKEAQHRVASAFIADGVTGRLLEREGYRGVDRCTGETTLRLRRHAR